MKDFYEKKIWKIEKKIFEKIFTNFFLLFFLIFLLRKFSASDFFLHEIFFSEIFYPFFYYSALGASAASSVVVGERSERRGGVGERSEPPAGGLAVGAEGSVNSELSLKNFPFLQKNSGKCDLFNQFKRR